VERLEGDEIDVFSLNSLNQQLPSLPKAVVPLAQAELDNEEKLVIPYSYQTSRIAATNSRNYVFYASSPNADVLGPYLEYCATKDLPENPNLPKFGLLFMSSYSLLRVYRVSAYRRCAPYSCGQDLVKFITLEGLSRSTNRECTGVFNVSIAALEYLNEDNIAVTVLSSPVTAWDKTTGVFVGATRTTYWLNPATMRLRRTVWQDDPASAGVPTQIPALCPALQRLPRVGTFAAELLNAGVFLVKYMVYAITYTPGLVPVWSAGSRCPAPGSALYHSVLANCGEKVFALDDFFDSLDDATAVFWHSLSLVARLIAPESKPDLARPITNILDGMSQYGQGAVDAWAGGAGLLTLTRVPIREQATQVWAVVQAGTAGDGARMVLGLASPGAGVLAWSRFAYKAFSTIALDLLKRFLDPLRDITLFGAFTLFWADLYDLREEFSATVTSRMRLACGGIKLMFGVDNPWANLLYHECAAGAELGDGMLRLALDVFVQIPMAKCVCKDVSGRSVPVQVTRKCAPPLPVSLLPTLYAITNELIGTQPIRTMACERVLESVKGSVSGALDPFFYHQFQALDALGSSVEYVTATFDDEAGRCLDFQNDPHVVVIVPQPIDYFSRCAGTSICRQVCSSEWQAFQDAGTPVVRPPETVSVTLESMFFPGELDAALVLTNASASVEVPEALGGCLRRSQQPDFAIAVAEVSAADVRVQFWCAPRMASSPVYVSDRAAYGPIKVPGALLDLQFGDDTGGWLAALAQLDNGLQGVYLLNSSGLFAAPPIPASLLGVGNTLLRLENMWLIEGFIVVDVLGRRLTSSVDPSTGQLGARAEPVVVHLALLPPLGTNFSIYGRWRTTDVDLIQFGRGAYWYFRLATEDAYPSDYMFIPRAQDGRLPFRVRLRRDRDRLVPSGAPVALEAVSLPAMGDAAFSARSQRPGVVFATSRKGWDWLKQVRLASDGYVEGVFGSAGVVYSVEIQGSCDEHGCEGCSSVQVQRLCLAYQKCALINCVGTPVHQRRPLCGIGALLRQTGRMGLVSTQGAWAVFSEMLGLALRLSLLNLKEAYLLWPEDQFLCFMCQAKDSSAHFFSILTATINSALQLGRADIGYMYGGASNVDTNADAVLTISSTAINSFMHQLTLFPLYGLAVSHQILMCQVSGVIALVPTGDFRVSIRAGKDTPAGDLIAGQCLTLGAEVLASFPKDDTDSLGIAATSLVSNALERLAIAQIEPILHIADGFLAYLIGVGKALGTLVQSQNMARCSPPDFFLKDVVNCACGDHVLQIPEARRREGVRQGALWCTGILGMIDSNNQPYYVHNKYTYAELQAKSAGLRDYVECVSQGTSGYSRCQPPNEEFFANQGVTTANVLVKCRENYMKKRWDPSAYMLFQSAYWDRIEFQEDPVMPSGVTHNVAACLADGDASTGSLVQMCHEQFLLDASLSPETYWQYERLNSTRAGPEFTDACLVFSGPAEKKLPDFQACVDGMEWTGNCTIPAHLWSPRSDNDVPLAEQHRVLSHGVNRDGLVQSLYNQALATVEDAIEASLRVWGSGDNPDVNAEFFSVEGDVLHQTMDCMFMGPYSRVDYWPVPDCAAGEECLRGPFWSRDEGRGSGRQVDPWTCSAPSSLPYTCGSPGRQSLMRYLILRLLPNGAGRPNQNTSNIGVILRSTLEDLAATWNDTDRYGCACGGRIDPACCLTNLSAPLLPEHLSQPFTSISSKSVLLALEDDMALLYELALENRRAWTLYMQDVSQNETAAYDWSGSKRATEEARFDPVSPRATYEAGTEAMSPLQQEDSTLWDVCHAALKQVFFTLPLDAAGSVRFDDGDVYDGDPARLEEFVKRFTAEAFLHSPLYRHYSPRHMPSDSQMCGNHSLDAADDSEGSVRYTDFVQAGSTLLSSRDLPTTSVYHPRRFLVGDDACLCGWPKRENRCYPPALYNTLTDLCRDAGVCSSDGSYAAGEEDAVLAVFSPTWHCPEVELSPHWGFLDTSANEDWLASNTTPSRLATSSRDLFRHGRSGLRPGNVMDMRRLAKEYISPATREVPLERGRLTTCQPPPPVQDLLQPFVDQLFPAAHGAEEAGALAYCLRYAIELARLEVLRLLDMPELEGDLALQRDVAEIWRKRCGTQLHLLHLCVSLGVYRPLANPGSRDPVACPHFSIGTSLPGVVYLTPQCLLSVDGVFYDPCRCQSVPCAGNQFQPLDVAAILGQGEACRLRFDPRTLLKTGAPIGWIDGVHPLQDPEAALLRPDFIFDILADSDAAGNVPLGQQWARAEGPLEENGELCDTILDWWPEDWDFPVGYHVTVPCQANDTAYRGFVQAFAWDESTQVMVYQHDLLRDASLADSHFGSTGLCRSGSFGMPMPETNNMRYCTRMHANDTEDFVLPLRNGADATDTEDAWSEWKCTSSSSRLPWPSMQANQGALQSARYSVGTIPNMPTETSPTYPATIRDMFDVGSWDDITDNGWGLSDETLCKDFDMLLCPDASACPPGFQCRGKVCKNDFSTECTGDSGCPGNSGPCLGVCVDPAVECIKHSDCTPDKMCTGVGTCERPVLILQNRLLETNDSVSWGVATQAESCGQGAQEFSLLRASYWGNTGQDILRAHGMCSFEDWFKYTYAYSQPGCSSEGDNETLRVDPLRCKLMDLQQLDANYSRWWPQGNNRPELMFVRPTVCDRDYERLEGFRQCAPLSGQAILRAPTGVWERTGLEYDRFVRLHADTMTKEILLARMDELNDTKVGFLGMGGAIGDLDELNSNPFTACGGVGQCFSFRFTVGGEEVQRRARPQPLLPWANYSDQSPFICGAFGMQTPDGCALDVDRFPLYRLLCVERLPSCRAFDIVTESTITRACSVITSTYQASRQDRTAILQGLRDLFYVFPLFNSLQEYLGVTSCMSDVYASMKQRAEADPEALSTSLYFPFMFALYEIPFDWFYQCIVMTGYRVQTAQRTPQTCQAHTTRAAHAPGNYQSVSNAGDSFRTYLQYVRAVYTQSDYEQYRADQLNQSRVELDNVVAGLIRDMFLSDRDLSYPRCSKNRLWKVGPYGGPYGEESFSPEKRAVIWNWYDSQSCSVSWHEKLLVRLEAIGVGRDVWTEALTDYDPVNLVRQDGSGSATLISEAKKFMLSSLDVKPVESIYTGISGAILFENMPRPRFDHQAQPLPPSLTPSPSVFTGTNEMDETVPLTCVFTPVFDPAFAGRYGSQECGTPVDRNVSSSRTDRIRTCGDGVECSTIPIYYQRDGRFNCRYIAESVLDSGTCNENSVDNCQIASMDKVYAEMYLRYRAAVTQEPPILRPIVPEWFQSSGWAFEAVDLSSLLDYERNIQPDQDRAVMCEITTDKDSATDFAACNNPHYLRLQRHADLHYRHDGSVKVPPGTQLEWPVDRAVLAQGVMFYYANTNRTLRKRYMDALFDNETVCKGTPAQHVCRKEGETSLKFRTLNPWTLGYFNPYEVCDVDYTTAGEGSREYIYTYCLLDGNPACREYLQRAPKTCSSKHRRLVQQVGVPRFQTGGGAYNDYNLCHHTVEEYSDGCMHDQGLLGGLDGLPVASIMSSSDSMIFNTKYEGTENYTVAKNLYENSDWSIPLDFRGGLFAGTNPLWGGGEAPYGFLQIDEADIGGHRIGLAVERNDTDDAFSTMLLQRLALGVDPEPQFLDSPRTGLPVQDWVPSLQADMESEDDRVSRLYDIDFPLSNLGASCPLQRWAFYSGNFPSFSPSLPSSKRSKHLFHRVHGGKLAHPTMLPGSSGQFLGKYLSSNGFCACPVHQDIPQTQCLVPVGSNSPCSLLTTMRTLMGKVDGQSYVYPSLTNEKSTRLCQMQLDWPLVDGRLRDGTNVTGEWSKASSPSHKECHILDRFRPFGYKYMASDSLRPSGRNTISDGVCKTARVATLQRDALPAQHARCLRSSLFDTSMLIECNTTTDTFTLNRRSRLTLSEVLARRDKARLRCSQCSKPPGFTSQHGKPIPPESSFGRLRRVSPERLLAKDLREALCPPGRTNCPTLNESAWRAGAFMDNFLLRPHTLFRNRSAYNRTTPSPPRESPSMWTSKPWVYCPSAQALRTGEGCQGTITRDAWEREKTKLCPQMVRSYSSSVTNTSEGDPMARTTFCSIDNTTDAVCKAIAKARQLVTQANCIARGDPACMPSPFVYHPASYEPSNNAWVHDSVKAFYNRTDPRACPANASANQRLVEFARAYQRTCPANGVNLFVGVLRAVRTIVVDASLLLTTLIGMAFRTLQLFIVSGRDATRNQIGKNWAYIRAKARATLDTVGDLLVDTMLNSGEVGARMMAFLLDACNALNSAAEWFLNVWCNYIQKYTLQFLAGVRKLLGITGAGFDVLQDFMDEVFQGILPAAFISKYAAGRNFQSMLTELYTSSNRKKQQQVASNAVDAIKDVAVAVPDTANPKQASRTAQLKSTLARVFGPAGRALRAVGKASLYASVALAGYETITGIINLIDEEKRRALYPENFTLFDLSDIVNVVDDMQDFILSPLSQQTCDSFQIVKKRSGDAKMIPCLGLELKRYSGTAEGTTSIDATMCWANAAPSLGQNSMFSCTASSTCRKAAGSQELILCATCPEPQLPGINRYGCNSLLQQCACSQLRVSYTPCAANRQCGATAECELVSALNGVSYGTIPCGNCPGTARLMCMLPPSGMPGRCSCMLAGAPTYDLCTDRSGLKTPVDSSRLCGYLHNRQDDIARWSFDMDDLIMLPCSQVSSGVCSDVHRAGYSEPLRMVVAETLRLSSGGGRRLLSDDEVKPDPGPPVYDAYESEYELTDTEALHELLTAPGWNTTAAPCSVLALAYQAGDKLGLLETHVLHTCGFWRYVGRRVLERYNLTEALAAHETFLLSMDDLVFAAMNPDAGLALLANPGVFVSAFMHHPWMKPVRALGVMIANQFEYLHWIRDIDADVHDALFGDLGPQENARQQKQEAIKRVQERISPRQVPRGERKQRLAEPESKPRGRRLLTVQDVLAYSARIIQNPDSTGQLPSRVYGAWSTAAFSWPPRYNYSLEACPIALSSLDLGTHVALVNKMYFENFDTPGPPIDRSLRGNLPGWDWASGVVPRPGSLRNSSSWASAAFHWLLDVASVRPEQLVAFFTSDRKWSLTWIAVSLTQCDLASTLTCSRHDKDLLMSTVVFALMFFLIHIIASSLGVGFVSTLFLLSYPWFILWYVFGMAPTCTPLLPTCLLSDVITTVERLVPARLLFPERLVCDRNQTCLRSCTELDFLDWSDPLAFAVCSTDDAACTYFQGWSSLGIQPLDDLLLAPLQRSMARFQSILRKGEDIGAYQLCTWVSFITVVPVLALLGSALLLVGVLTVAIMDLLPPFVGLVCQSYVFYES
jgi:hypothetical protein